MSEQHKERPTKNPEAGRCDHYLEIKKRFCRAEKGKGSDFCGAHRVDGSRVPCPINPNHSVYKADLEKHILVCPDLRYQPDGKPFHRKGVNGRRSCPDIMKQNTPVDLDAAPPYAMYKKHKQLSDDELRELQKKLRVLFTGLVEPELSDDFLYEPTSAELENVDQDGDEHDFPGDAEDDIPKRPLEQTSTEPRKVRDQHSGHKTQKHTPQHIGLLNQLVSVGCLPSEFHTPQSSAPIVPAEQVQATPAVFLELGAGKAGLAMALREKLADLLTTEDKKASQEVSKLALSTTIVVDRGNFRHKKDGCYSLSSSPFHRLRLDIQDFVLDGVDQVKSAVNQDPASNGGTLGLGKHLCGGCTDFALNSLLLAPFSTTRPQAVVIATCCHHLCDPAMIFSWAQGLQGDDELLTMAKQLHLLRNKRGRETAANNEEEDDIFALYQSLTVDDWSCLISLTSWGVCGDRVSAAQQELGRMAKRLIDWTRIKHAMQFVRQNTDADTGPSWSGALRHFVPRSVTKENACILLWR